MKKPNYIIKINKPCQENWDEMTQNDKGKHCAVCAKTVVDFSKLSDNQVIKLIENSKGKVCGHFNKTQLNRALTQTNEQANPFLYQILAGALLLSSCDTTPKETPNIEVISTQNDEKKSAQTDKSTTKIACEKIEEDDSLRKIQEWQEQLQMIQKGDYIIENGEISVIDLNSIDDVDSVPKNKYKTISTK